MASVFTKIINGELPGRYVNTADKAVAFLSIAPLTPGHTLVVPREEIDQRPDAGQPLLAHSLAVARQLGNADKREFEAPRAGLVIAGLEVPHLHVHVFPVWSLNDFSFANATPASDEDLDEAAARLRAALAQA